MCRHSFALQNSCISYQSSGQMTQTGNQGFSFVSNTDCGCKMEGRISDEGTTQYLDKMLSKVNSKWGVTSGILL